MEYFLSISLNSALYISTKIYLNRWRTDLRSVAERIRRSHRLHWPPLPLTRTIYIAPYLFSGVGLVLRKHIQRSDIHFHFVFGIYDKSKFCQLHAQCSSGPYCQMVRWLFLHPNGHIVCFVCAFAWDEYKSMDIDVFKPNDTFLSIHANLLRSIYFRFEWDISYLYGNCIYDGIEYPFMWHICVKIIFCTLHVP